MRRAALANDAPKLIDGFKARYGKQGRSELLARLDGKPPT